ncbi:hypothetical protein BKA69DRAFT_1176614 [Paraphysoderma sedebokerense]|nr:hypothetical protein BKA69DRAFT_1176614 [Paraphysoderma sedebokerense]
MFFVMQAFLIVQPSIQQLGPTYNNKNKNHTPNANMSKTTPCLLSPLIILKESHGIRFISARSDLWIWPLPLSCSFTVCSQYQIQLFVATPLIKSSSTLNYSNTVLFDSFTWTLQCASTGHQNLNFFQALESERANKTSVPDPLKGKLLETIHHSQESLNHLVEKLYETHKNRYYEGETVSFKNKSTNYKGIIVSLSPDCPPDSDVSTHKYLVKSYQYKSDVLSGNIVTLPVQELWRNRVIFSKNNFKKFIRENALRENCSVNGIGGYWAVKSELVAKYNLFDGPPDLQPKKRKRKNQTASDETKDSKKQKVAKKDPIRYPIEDLQLPIPDPKIHVPGRPRAQTDFAIPQHCMSDFLQIWSFLSIYGTPLNLFPFTLDDFESSLHHSSILPRCHLTSSYMSSLLSVLLKEYNTSRNKKPGKRDNTFRLQSNLYHYVTTNDSGLKMENGDAGDNDENAEDDEKDGDTESQISIVEDSPNPNIPTNGLSATQAPILNLSSFSYDWSTWHSSSESRSLIWEEQLIGALIELGTSDAIPDLYEAIDILVGKKLRGGSDVDSNGDDTTQEAEESNEEHEYEEGYAEEGWTKLRVDLRIQVLKWLIEIAGNSLIIRDYMEECEQKLHELRKERIEVNRDRKVVLSEQQELEKQYGSDNPTPDQTDSQTQSQSDINGDVQSQTQDGDKEVESQNADEDMEEADGDDAGNEGDKEGEGDNDSVDVESSLSGPLSDLSDDERFGSGDEIEGGDDDRSSTHTSSTSTPSSTAPRRSSRRQSQQSQTSSTRPSSRQPTRQALSRSLRSQSSSHSHTQGRDQEQEDDEFDYNSLRRIANSRQARLKEAAFQREQEEQARLEEFERERELQRVKKREMKVRSEARRRLETTSLKLHKKLAHLEKEFRKYSILRIKPLGKDRYFNTYWFLDYIGSGSVLGFNCGRVFVEGSGLGIQEPVTGESNSNPQETVKKENGNTNINGLSNTDGEIIQVDGKIYDMGKMRKGVWGIYEDSEQIDALLSWLNPKGIREHHLKKVLTNMYDLILSSMTKRSEETSYLLKAETERRSTRSKNVYSREGYLGYTNKWAKQKKSRIIVVNEVSEWYQERLKL